MRYAPHYSKLRKCWVPGAFLSQMTHVVETWDEFCSHLQDPPPVYDEKGKIPSISPGVLTRGSEKREAKNVESIWFLAIDLDQGEDDFAFVKKRVEELDIDAIFHTTWSHLQPGKGERWRVYIRLDRPVPAKDWGRFWRAAMLLFTGSADARIKADKSCGNADRVYYAPGVAPGFEHTYQCFRTASRVQLPLEEVWESIGSAVAASPSAPAEDRVAVIATHRAMMTPYARKLSSDDLTALGKDKKRVPDADMRAAFRAAATGERMVVAKDENEGGILRQSDKDGLFRGDVDTFLTQLTYRLAMYHRNADPAEVVRVFAGSMGVLADDDRRIGKHTPYEPDALASKFASAVIALDEEEVEKAAKLGVPTKAEFTIAHGLEVDGKRVSAELPGRIWQGHNCFFVWRKGEGGELEPHPISNFAIVPREIWRSESADDHGNRALKYVVDLVGANRTYERVEMPSDAVTSAKAMTDFLKPFHPFVWKGASDDQTRDLRLRIEDYAQQHGVQQFVSTHKLGLRVEDGTIVAPQITFKSDGALGITRVEDGVRFERNNNFMWNRGVHETLARRDPAHVDLDVMREFARLVMQLNDPSVVWPSIGWFTASVIRPLIVEAQKAFPHLQMVGSQGSGKSFLAARFAVDALGGHEVSIQNMPFYSAARECAGITSLPIFFEEFRDDEKSKKWKVKDVRSLLRSAYNSTRITRATFADLIVEAPLVFAGEQRIFGEHADYDRAVAERMIMVRPKLTYTHEEKTSDIPRARGYRAAFEALNELPIEDSGMCFVFPAWIAARWNNVPHVRVWLQAAQKWVGPPISAWPFSASARIYENLRVVWFGCQIWKEWCDAIGVPCTLPDPLIACRSTLEEVCGMPLASDDGSGDATAVARDQTDPILRLIEEVSMLLTAQGFQGSLSTTNFWHVDRASGSLWLDIPVLLKFYTERGGDGATVPSAQQVYQYAEESSYCDKDGAVGARFRHVIPGAGRGYSHCIRLKLSELERAQISLANAFTQTDTATGAITSPPPAP